MKDDLDLHNAPEILGEIAGQMHASIEAFNQRLGEAMAQLRLTTNEQRAEGTQALEYLQGIVKQAKSVQVAHQNLVRLIEQQWPARMDAAARSAGEAQAQAFGERIAQGIHGSLSKASEQAERAAQRLEQAARALRWKTGMVFAAAALSFAVMIGIYLWVMNARAGAQLDALKIERAELAQSVQVLKDAGGELDLARCAADDPRICVRIGSRERFGPERDYVPAQLRKRP